MSFKIHVENTWMTVLFYWEGTIWSIKLFSIIEISVPRQGNGRSCVCVRACVCVCVVSILLLFLWSFYCMLELFRQCGICFSFYHCNCTQALFGILMCYRSLGYSRYCYLLCVTLSGFYIRHSFTIFTKIKKNKNYFLWQLVLRLDWTIIGSAL